MEAVVINKLKELVALKKVSDVILATPGLIRVSRYRKTIFLGLHFMGNFIANF